MQPNNIRPFRNQQPMFNIPNVVIVFLVINIAVFIWQNYFLNPVDENDFIYHFAFIPERLSTEFSFQAFLTMITSSFLHANWTHVGMNMLYMIIFGSPLAKHMEASGFIVFWIFTSICALFFYYILNLNSDSAVIGASGVVSAMLGAIARFGYTGSLFHPVLYGKVLPIDVAIRSREIITIMGFWLGINLLYGLADNTIAWQVHIGGLVIGFLSVGLFVSHKK